jgi:DNA polymerase-3 subunit alpha (Gram-positive type)
MLTTLEACYEFYLRGYGFAGVDIFESDPALFLVVGEKTLRPPLVAVSGLGETAAADIAEQRVLGGFVSVEDISAVCFKVTKAHIEHLKALGAMSALPETSQLTLF